MKQHIIALTGLLLGLAAGAAQAQTSAISMSVGLDGNVRILYIQNGQYIVETLKPSPLTLVASSPISGIPNYWIPTKIATGPSNNTIVAFEDTAAEPAVLLDSLNSQDQEYGPIEVADIPSINLSYGTPTLTGFGLDPNNNLWVAQQQEYAHYQGEPAASTFSVGEFPSVNSYYPSSSFSLGGTAEGMNGFAVRGAPYELLYGGYGYTYTSLFENQSLILQQGLISGWTPNSLAAYSNGSLAIMWQGAGVYSVWNMLGNGGSAWSSPAFQLPSGGSLGPSAACPDFPAPLNLYFCVNLGGNGFYLYDYNPATNQVTLL